MHSIVFVWANEVVRKEQNLHEILCWHHEPCLMDVEVLHAEADVNLRHRQRRPSLRLVSTRQDIWGSHLQHTTLLWVSPTSFKKWTPTLGLLNRNARNSLLATQLPPSVTPERRGRNERTAWNWGAIGTCISVTGVLNVQFVRTRKNNSKYTSAQHSEQEQHSQQKPNRYWRPTWWRRNVARSPEENEETLWIFHVFHRCPSR